MAPSPQETMVEQQQESIPRGLTGDAVVISGMSGLFPKSDSVLKFMENLYNKVDMVSNEGLRWDINHPEIPKHFGMINGVDKFDAQFFKVHYKQALILDPMSRKLLEHAYSAIYDAGINPSTLRGTNVGVFIGTAFSESEKIAIYETVQRNGFGITGCNKAMYANRISYWLDGKGPSYALDVACASSMACLEHAYRSISTGQCDTAIVGGCNLCMHPNVALNMRKYGFLCLDGKTKCFDKNGDGAVRSDAISILFLQKAKDAKRIYSEVYHAKSSYTKNLGEEFLPIREPKEIQDFLEAFYSEIGVSPRDVEYVEACGSAIAKADGNELEAIGKVYAKDKNIQIGCVKSNMGHSEPASGVCSLTKLCLAYHKGQIPGNLHYYEPQDQIDSVRNGSVQVVTETVPFGRGFSALNSFSYSGANIHVLLKGHYKPKDQDRYKTSIPYIILISGRQDQCVKNTIENFNNLPVDPEQIGLIHDIHENYIPGHTCRGFTIIETNAMKETVCLAKEVEYADGTTSPIWFMYSGMGSQWATMGAELMRIPIFAAAIEKCARALEPKGIDIVNILTNPDKRIYDNILHSFVGIAAVQIGLTDVLTAIGIVPDNIIGHSVGELGCAYADGCFTAEEMILAAYSRGLVSVQTPFIRGSMAAVGLGYKTVRDICPPEIEVACHNSSESSTISGPADIMKKFVGELTAKGIFAKEVPCSNIAFHSRYIQDGGPELLKYLKEVIKNPKQRSKKWVSTSVPQDEWDQPKAQLSSAEYHTNNLLNSVLFEETASLIPSNALVIEVAPHGLLQAIIKRSLPECKHIPLTRRGHADPVKFMLEAIGKIYIAGFNPKVQALYPKLEYPVSTETPLLSHLVEWEHSEEWPQARFNAKDRITATSRNFVMSIHDDDYKCFEGYMRDDTYIFPEAALLILIWETLAMQQGVNYRAMSVELSNIHFYEEAEIKANEPLKLGIMIHKGNHYFEVNRNQTTLVTGFIHEIKRDSVRPLKMPVNRSDVLIGTRDIYKMLKMRGYSYKGDFQSIHSTTLEKTSANIKYTNDWIAFLDSILQFNTFKREYAGISIVKHINKLTINVDKHANANQLDVNGVNCLNAEYYDGFGITRCGGIEIDTITFNDKPIIQTDPDILHDCCFIPHFLQGKIDLKSALHVNFQIIAENIATNNIKVTELLSMKHPQISNFIREVTEEIPNKYFLLNDSNKDATAAVFVIDNLLEDKHKTKTLARVLDQKSFILAFEKSTARIQPNYEHFNVVTAMYVQEHILVLLNKADTNDDENITYLPIAYDGKFSWVSRVVMEIERTRKVVLVSERQPYSGVLGMVKKLREEYGDKIRLIVVDDYHVPHFSLESDIFKQQLEKKLAINVLKKGQWGGYYSIPRNKTVNVKNITLSRAVPGDLDSLKWVEAPSMPASNTMVQVCYAGLSSDDALNAAGTSLLPSNEFGKDFSGIDINGKRVMGLIPEGALSSTVEADPDLLWPVPENWSLEDAATVPLAYVHAYYCLTIAVNALKNKPLFVNGATEPLGQAIISLALHLDSPIYATVDDLQKKEHLLRMFPQLDEKNIGCSRIDTAHNMVIINTKTQCCDIAINCFSGPLRESTMKCVGFAGYILDVNDVDMKNNKDFGMSYLQGEKNYKAVRMTSIFKPEYARDKKLLQSMLAEGIAKGIVRPLNRVVYSPMSISRAFRLLSSKRHSGKIVIRMRDPQVSSQQLNVTPKLTYSSNGTYLIVCDENELGIEVADRLVNRGAKKLIVNLNPSSLTGYTYTKLASWKKLDVQIHISSENLLTDKGCINLLKEGSSMGPVLGIFVIQNYYKESKIQTLEPESIAHTYNKTVPIVANLDVTSRKLCNHLEHFVVLNCCSTSVIDEYTVSVIDKICEARNEACLPALTFHVQSIKEFETNVNKDTKTRPQKLSTVMNALETSLKLNYNNVVSYDLKKRNNTDFLEKISKIIGVNNISNIEESLTLNDLLVNEVSLEEIKYLIKEIYDISFSTKTVAELDVASLKNFGSIVKRPNTRFNAGLGAFFTYTDNDECMATEPMVQMPTKLGNASEEEQELDPKATYLMLIPGFEGHHQIFTRVCERLKVQAMTFQLCPDMTEDCIQKIASNIMKFIKKRFELKSKFYLLGYSFGVNVALELARYFEKEGHVGIVYCLDSSPDALKVQLDAYVGNLTDSELQNTITEHMYRLMTGKDSDELKKDLEKLESWSEKIEACVNRLRGLVSYSNQYKRSILQAAYRRILLAKQYEPDFQLESELVLMKGIPHPNAENLSADYNLSKYTKQPVKVFEIESDHVSAPYDCRVSNIVNRFLEPKILTEFEQKCLCDSYFADSFKLL